MLGVNWACITACQAAYKATLIAGIWVKKLAKVFMSGRTTNQKKAQRQRHRMAWHSNLANLLLTQLLTVYGSAFLLMMTAQVLALSLEKDLAHFWLDHYASNAPTVPIRYTRHKTYHQMTLL